jgi:hypothetical protein
MKPFATILRREYRIAFSRHAQPVWFRIAKWAAVLTGVIVFHDRAGFWWCLAGLAVAGAGLHFFYRSKTKNWTRAWGGWNDLEAGRDR